MPDLSLDYELERADRELRNAGDDASAAAWARRWGTDAVSALRDLQREAAELRLNEWDDE